MQQRDAKGAVTAAAMVGRAGGSLVVAVAGDSPSNPMAHPLQQMFVLESLNATQCPGMEVWRASLSTWRSLRPGVFELIALYAQGAETTLTLRVSGYSGGAPVAALFSLEIAWALGSGALPRDKLQLGPTHTFGGGSLGNLAFVQCYERWVGSTSGHFAVVHGRDPLRTTHDPSLDP